MTYPRINSSHPSLTADSEHKLLAGQPDGAAELQNEKLLLEYKALHTLYEADKEAVDATLLCNRYDGTCISLQIEHNYDYQIQGLLGCQWLQDM